MRNLVSSMVAAAAADSSADDERDESVSGARCATMRGDASSDASDGTMRTSASGRLCRR